MKTLVKIATFVLAVPLVLLAPFAHAQELGRKNRPQVFTLQNAVGDPAGWTIGGSVRARYESLTNQFRPRLDRHDNVVSLKTTLSVQYDSGPVRIGAEAMDSRAYFTEAGSAVGPSDVNAVELIQGYVGLDLDNAFGNGTKASLDVGRFTLALGSRRLVSRNNFRNTTNAFAGAKGQFRTANGTTLTLFYTLPLNRMPNDKQGVLDNSVQWDREGFDLTFWGAFLNKPRLVGRSNLDLYVFGLQEKDDPAIPTRDRHLITPGLRLFEEASPGNPDFELEGAYQFGSASASTAESAQRKDVDAWFFRAEAGFQFKLPWQPRVALEYDRASGDHGGRKYTRFDSLYGSRRSDFGPTAIYGPLSRSNLSSPGVRVELKPSSEWDGFVMYRALWLDSATDSFANTGIIDASGASGKFAGHQVEWRLRKWLVPKLLRLDTGGAILIDGRFIRNAPNANAFGNTAYFYSDLTATF